jgi:hypothetical protein
MDFECLICTEDFNQSKHTKVSCPSCSFAACRTCCQHYILDQEASVCMNKGKKPDDSYICQKEWSRQFVTANFPKTWVNNQWKQMNQKVGVEREKALLPATMAVVEQRKEIRLMEIEVEAIDRQIEILKQRKWNLKQQIRAGGSVVTVKAVTRGRACPDTECRGYLSTQWKCGLCDKWTCPDCHEIKGGSRDTEHTCDPDTKATAQLLARDTKPCPKCAIPIHKIEGCDQMWCPECHTAFSWRRGTIETRIHNPHYYEWLRNNNGGTAPRNAGDVECGRELTARRVERMFAELHSNLPSYPAEINDIRTKITAVIRNTIHLNEVQGPRFQTNNVVDNLEIRVGYLEGKIDEKWFASRVHTADKAFQKKRDISDVIHLQVQGVTDIVYRMVDVLKYRGERHNDWTPDRAAREKFLWFQGELSTIYSNISSLYDEFKVLTNYSNSILGEHSVTYNSKRYTIHMIGRKMNGDVMY